MIEDIGAAALVGAARAAARHAHAPYSRFAVGAAVLLEDGTIVTGANFENASYGLSLCAETVALASVNAQGRLGAVVALAVTGGAMGADGPEGAAIVNPCGRCRQVINEAAQMAGRDLVIFCASPDGAHIRRHTISSLLPDAFGPADLGFGPAPRN
ncbi:cytidine deaminase [Sphingomonas morindae]|uniref:Cytidine deaminase n=1 Tax=Sphingomonas morindae TaxID=1541170 RepID=A0ABY4XC86_9SPHN|nr:cytidine deaminase [Sphingomonas morindae]USI74578.1 cytidine deaminase [Sphingomonas morindae]